MLRACARPEREDKQVLASTASGIASGCLLHRLACTAPWGPRCECFIRLRGTMRRGGPSACFHLGSGRAPDIFPTQGWNDWHIPGAGPRLARPESPEHVEWRCSAEGCLDMAGKLWVDTVWHRGKFQMLQLSEDEDAKKKAEKKKKKDNWIKRVQNRRAQSRRAAVLIWIDWLATENLLALLCCSEPVASDLQTGARQKNCEGVMFCILWLRRDLCIHDMADLVVVPLHQETAKIIIQNHPKSKFLTSTVVFFGIISIHIHPYSSISYIPRNSQPFFWGPLWSKWLRQGRKETVQAAWSWVSAVRECHGIYPLVY